MNRLILETGTRIRQAGLSLVEMMVALVIGSVLISGAFGVYLSSKQSYGDNEAVSRLQETARFAMSVIEADVREANFWGLLKGGQFVTNGITVDFPQNVGPPPAPFPNSAALQVCGANFAVDTTAPVQGDNNRYRLSLSNTRQPACDTLADFSSGNAWATTPVTTADTLTVRRASAIRETGPFPEAGGMVQVCSSRASGYLTTDGGAACDAFPTGQVNNLVVNAYYVDQNSQQQAGFPSLHRKMLVAVGGVPQFRDQEVIAGVEDLQVQFGIEPLPAAGTAWTGVAQSYVDPEAVPAGAQVVAVRIWLLVRADAGEANFTDNRLYRYGDRLAGATGDLNVAANAGLAYQPSLSADASFNGPRHTRHLLISRTIQIRNRNGP